MCLHLQLLQLGLSKPRPPVPALVKLLVQAVALANLVLDVKVAGFQPGVDITDNVAVLHHGGMGEHLVLGDPLIPAVQPQHSFFSSTALFKRYNHLIQIGECN